MTKRCYANSETKRKVGKVMARGYIAKEYVASLTGFFPVQKGKDDIRVVYDASKCRLNNAVWAPNFYLPSVDTILRSVEATTFYGDIDLGEMFLNYTLDEKIQPYAGVDVTYLVIGLKPQKDLREWWRWNRSLIGIRPYLYVYKRKSMGK